MSRRQISTWPNRTFCDTLDEMRQCFKTLNLTAIPGLIEECQTFGNRMEAALADQRDYKEMNEALHELKKEYKPLKEEVEKLEEKIEKLKKEKAKLEGKDSDDDTTE